jgi:hypothetical protein
MGSWLAWEIGLFAVWVMLIITSNFVVYHANLLHTCNFTVLMASVMVLSYRLLLSQYEELKSLHPVAMPPMHVLLWTVVLAQLGGSAAWLARRLVEETWEGHKLIWFVCLPFSLWWLAHHALWYWEGNALVEKKDDDVLDALRRYRQLCIVRLAGIVETALLHSYVIGLLPPLFASPYLFFDWMRLVLFCNCLCFLLFA